VSKAAGLTVTKAATLAVEEVVAGYVAAPVLNGVSIGAAAGTITAVLGANGAGKTTLLRTISGLIRPRSGRILLDGTSMTRRNPEDIARALGGAGRDV
jgi:branched-chain amino acid transport system ATP-binding protein